jgi:hypothetical protein
MLDLNWGMPLSRGKKAASREFATRAVLDYRAGDMMQGN